jgi:hypothetical protein
MNQLLLGVLWIVAERQSEACIGYFPVTKTKNLTKKILNLL